MTASGEVRWVQVYFGTATHATHAHVKLVTPTSQQLGPGAATIKLEVKGTAKRCHFLFKKVIPLRLAWTVQTLVAATVRN